MASIKIVCSSFDFHHNAFQINKVLQMQINNKGTIWQNFQVTANYIASI